MPHVYLLSDLERGVEAKVCRLDTKGTMRRRLMDLGLTPGAPVTALFKSCSGDPTAYLIRGAVVALRSDDAGTVIVTRP